MKAPVRDSPDIEVVRPDEGPTLGSLGDRARHADTVPATGAIAVRIDG